MANKFKALAIETTCLSELMADREMVTTDHIISRYPEGVTIIAFDIVKLSDAEEDRYPILVCKENTDIFFNGGLVLLKVVERWMEGYSSAEEASADLLTEGGVKVKLSKGKTKNGRTITKVEII